MMIEFHIPGEPVAKGRARSFIRGGHIAHHTPKKTANYESLVALAAQFHMAATRQAMLEGPLLLTFSAVFTIPKSWSKKRKAANDLVPEFVTKRPDLDNIAKALSDGMNGVVYADDSQIVKMSCCKFYGDRPGVWVIVARVT